MAKQRSKSIRGTGNLSSAGSEEFEVAPFSFDAAQSESLARSANNSGKLPDMPLGQFSDAEMEFEPFMFNMGEGQQAGKGLNTETAPAAPSGFSFEPFQTGSLSKAAEALGSPIVGGELPMPAYFSPTSVEAEPGSENESWEAEMPTTPVGNDHTTSGLVLPTGPMSASSLTDTGGLGANRGDQMTGRTPTGPTPAVPTPSTPLTTPATTPVTNLGRTRGNTGPLGPLPPDRVASPNASWSDSSLASIEDFSSILIAMQAGKKLRQSGPLSESMLPPTVAQQAQSPVVEQRAAATATPAAPTFTPSKVEAFEYASDNNDMPEWARQATQESTVVEERAPYIDMGTGQAVESGEETASAPEFSWMTGHMDEPAAGMESAAAPVMEAPAAEAPTQQVSEMTSAAQAELEKSHRKDEEPSNLEPEVAAVLKKAEPVLASGTLTGDELEFEGFMFNKGASSPLNALPGPTADEMEDLHQDMGPVFDPTLYSVAAEDDSDGGTEEYGDFEGFLSGELQEPNVAPGQTNAPADTSSATGGLPFWLQGDANEAPTGMLLQDIARRGWGTKEFLVEQPQPSIPSEWVGSAGDTTQKAAPKQPSRTDLFGSIPDEDSDYGQLPPIEPFDFAALPANDKVESLGFNTEELTGMSMVHDDPMTATVNLAAVADLLGAPEDTWAEETPVQPTDEVQWDATQSAPAEQVPQPGWMQDAPAPQEEWSQVAEGDVEMPTVTSLDAYDAEAVEPTMEMEPAIEMHSEMPTMEAVDASGVAESEYAQVDEVEMPTLTLDAGATDYGDYGTVEPVQEVSAEMLSGEVEAPQMMEAAPAAEAPAYEAEAPSEPEYTAPTTPSAQSAPAPSLPTAPIGESMSTRSWMSNATTDLSEGALADMAGEQSSLISPVTEMDLAMDGEVAPFNYDQLELEGDEQHTGHLEADQISRTYGTGKLAMPDEDDMIMRSRPLSDMWSEADGDASLFVTGPRDSEETSQDGPAAYAAATEQEDEAYVEPMETQDVAVVMFAEPTPDYVEMANIEPEPPVEEFKVRVANRPWMAYTETQARVEIHAPTPMPMPMPMQQAPQPEPMQQASAPYGEYRIETTGPLQEENAGEYVPSPVYNAAQEQNEQRTPNFEREVRMPSNIDILVTGPLPSLEGFEDVNEWAGSNTQDMGAQLAKASAYAQAQDFDAALRVYRKIIRSPTVSETMLKMIGDDLTDIEDDASHLPRYYQVVGDLLLKLGRHREAIEAYNKLK